MPAIYLAAAVQFVAGALVLAQIPHEFTPGNTGWGMILGGIITAIIGAIATGFWKPWLDYRRDERNYKAANARISEMEREMVDMQAQLHNYEKDRNSFIERVRTLTDTNVSLTERNVRLINILLVNLRYQRSDVPFRMEQVLIGDQATADDGPTVLIVEDDPKAREGLKQLLILFHCRVQTAEGLVDGCDALESKPQYILLDLMLPEGSGVEIVKRVAEMGLRTKIIVISAKSPEQLAAIPEIRELSVLSKPFDFFKDLIPLIVPAAAGGVIK